MVSKKKPTVNLLDHFVSHIRGFRALHQTESNTEAGKRGSHKRHFVWFPLKQRQNPRRANNARGPAPAPPRGAAATDRLPTGSPLPAIFFKAVLFPVKNQPFHPVPASEPGDRPHLRAATRGAAAAARAPAAFCCASGDGTALPRPGGTSAQRGRHDHSQRQGAAPTPASSPRQPRGTSPLRRGMRSPPAVPLLAPALPRSPLSLTHAVLLVLRGYPHARDVRAPAPRRPAAPPPAERPLPGCSRRRSAAAARSRQRTHCSAGRADQLTQARPPPATYMPRPAARRGT